MFITLLPCSNCHCVTRFVMRKVGGLQSHDPRMTKAFEDKIPRLKIGHKGVSYKHMDMDKWWLPHSVIFWILLPKSRHRGNYFIFWLCLGWEEGPISGIFMALGIWVASTQKLHITVQEAIPKKEGAILPSNRHAVFDWQPHKSGGSIQPWQSCPLWSPSQPFAPPHHQHHIQTGLGTPSSPRLLSSTLGWTQRLSQWPPSTASQRPFGRLP